jgi:hypothetical protein
MTLDQLIAQKRAEIAAKLKERAANVTGLAEIRGKEEATEADEAKATELRTANQTIDTEVRGLEVKVAEYESERASDAAADALANVRTEGAASPNERKTSATVVTSEERVYAPHKERGFDQATGKIVRGVKAGGDFERDVAAAFFGDYEAQGRLSRHMAEEKVERGDAIARAANSQEVRAAGTGAFAGLTVPQYLTDLYAPATAAMRPFADACNKHVLPESGMTVNLSRITTSTSAALQA